MASWMEAKELKRKRRRAQNRLKSAGPFPGWSAEYHQRAKTNRDHDIPATSGLKMVVVDGDVIIPAKVWAGVTRMNGVDGFKFVTLKIGRLTSVRMYFSGMTFFLLELNHVLKFARRSIIYRSRETAMERLSQGRVTYVEKLSLPHPSASPDGTLLDD